MKKALAVVELLLAALVVASLYLFVFVPTQQPRHADALVVLSSARQRYDLGLRLYDQHVARTLVLSLPSFEASGGNDCPRSAVCFHAHPYSTRGEAETVARLAHARSWHRIIVVTSRYHVRRARMLFRRCLGETNVEVVAAPAERSAYFRNIPLEWAKLAYQLIRERHC